MSSKQDSAKDKELKKLRAFKALAKEIAENLLWRVDEGLTVRLLIGEQNGE